MLDFTNTIFEQVVVHKVGNIARNENLVLAKSPARLNEDVKSLLATYFLRAFKDPQFYIFDYESNYKDNRVFALVSEIFDDPNSLYQNSTKMANYLFEVADHPNIKGGEFYVVYFKDCMVNDELVDAIGLFKSENKETFLKVYQENDDFTISHDEGININKLDKGCIIFNTEKEFGYKLSIVDKTNKNTEALYWVYDF